MPESNLTSSQTADSGPESTSSSLRSKAEGAAASLLTWLDVRAVILTVKGKDETVHVAACDPKLPGVDVVCLALDAMDADCRLLRKVLVIREKEEKEKENADRPTPDGERAG